MSTFPDQFRLNGRTALVTGSGRGLGWEMAQGLAQAGARVLLHGRSAERLTSRVARTARRGQPPMPSPSTWPTAQSMAGAVGQGRPDRHPDPQCRRARSPRLPRHRARGLRPPDRCRPHRRPCPGRLAGARHDRARLGPADPGHLDRGRSRRAQCFVLCRGQGRTGGTGARARCRVRGQGHHVERAVARLLRHRDQRPA